MRFAYVPFGSRAPPAAVACDGLVPGAQVDLSHWAGNETPAHLKHDTSVEIALAFARSRGSFDVEVVSNNHFDTDGVLACWAVLHPQLALEHAGLITAAAEAGDFDEWPSDERGLWLDASIATLAAGRGDREAYAGVLPELEALIPNLAAREELWGEAHRSLVAAYGLVERGAISVEQEGRIAVIAHQPGTSELPGPWISRLAAKDADRWLLAFADREGGHRYRYELPRWTWADTVRRPRIAMPRRGPIRRTLGPEWIIKGRSGMTGVAHTAQAIRATPREIAERLRALELS